MRLSVREVICGAGEAGDRTVGRDALDGLRAAADRAVAAGRRAMFVELLELFGDSDPHVRTGAVIGLDAVRAAWDAERMVGALDAHAAALAIAPVGFGAIHPSLTDEVLVRAADVVRPGQVGALTRLSAAAHGHLRPWIVANLAATVPDLVVANAARWGRPSETGPLFRLGRHTDRLAFAAALAPWGPDAVARVRNGPWPGSEPAELAAAMTGPPAGA